LLCVTSAPSGTLRIPMYLVTTLPSTLRTSWAKA
jgi:hypothetical protein